VATTFQLHHQRHSPVEIRKCQANYVLKKAAISTEAVVESTCIRKTFLCLKNRMKVHLVCNARARFRATRKSDTFGHRFDGWFAVRRRHSRADASLAGSIAL
jgi:hypothetical protein